MSLSSLPQHRWEQSWEDEGQLSLLGNGRDRQAHFGLKDAPKGVTTGPQHTAPGGSPFWHLQGLGKISTGLSNEQIDEDLEVI